MIKPTVGRVVWYYANLTLIKQEQPFAAIITYVHDDKLINVVYFDENGRISNHTSIQLIQEEYNGFPNGAYCTWMPYQQAVAKGELPPTVHAP